VFAKGARGVVCVGRVRRWILDEAVVSCCGDSNGTGCSIGSLVGCEWAHAPYRGDPEQSV
jgi:hypothetical protein